MQESLPRQIFPTGAQIFTEGEAGHFAYVIENGKVEVSTLTNGRRVILAQLGDGELLGEMALIDDKSRSATAIALEDTQVVVLDRAELQDRIGQADELLQVLLRVTIERLRTTQRVMVSESVESLGSKCRAEHVRQRDELMKDLQTAIEKETLSLHYQPIVDLADGRVAGFEALVRWDHPVHGEIVPSSFISLAEETGTIVPMGHWMLGQALEAQKRLNERRTVGPAIYMSVNVSRRQLLSGSEAQGLADVVLRSGVQPENVTFEVTETLMVEQPENVADAMLRLRKQGIRIAADDFGTGYANLAFLNRFPLDVLKIDRSFITNMAGDPRSRKIVNTIINLAKDFGMSIIAEGIESAAEIKVLRELDCDFGQGFLLSRPVPVEAAEALVRQRVRW